MIDRKELAEEVALREQVRRTIAIIQRKKQKKLLEENKEETELRKLIQNLIGEAKKIATYDSTGKNELNVFLLNSSFLSTLETSYRKMTTSTEQRSSYIDHMVNAVKDYLNTLNSLADDGPVDLSEEEETVNISIGEDEPSDDPKFMGDALEAGETKMEDPEEIEFEKFVLRGRDMTGAKNAYRDFKNTKDIIRDAYGTLSAPEDKAAFAEELPTQIILYGQAWEKTLQPEVEIPADIEAAAGGDVAQGGESPDENIANIELQEILKHLNVDDIIENLL